MNTEKVILHDWTQKIEAELLQLNDVPLIGNFPSFPWDQLTTALSTTFEAERLQLSPKEIKIRSEKELFKGLGEPKEAIRFSLSPLPGELCLVTGEKNINKLIGWLTKQNQADVELFNETIKRSFYRFFIAQAMFEMESLEFDEGLEPHLNANMALPTKSALCIDINLKKQRSSILFRLVVEEEFRKAWVEYCAPKKPSELSQKIAEKIDVCLPLEIGRTTLSLSQWKNAKVGDFILLDTCSFDPDAIQKSHFILTLNNRPIFRTRLKKEGIKILDHNFYNEVNAAMEDEKYNDLTEDFANEEEEDFSTHLDEESETEEVNMEDSPQADAEEGAEDAPIEASEEVPAEEAPSTETVETEAPEEAIIEETESTPHQEMISANEMMILLSVEVARINMSAKRVMELSPGNILPLDVQPSNIADLVVRGKRVGKGEIVRIGDALGVRITEMGK